VRFSDEVVRHSELATTMLISMGIFVAILLIAYFYAWGKGVFRWD